MIGGLALVKSWAHGGRVEYGVELAAFEEREGAVHAQLTDPNGQTHTVRCRWLVGCDGAHSKVRSTLGLAFEGGQYPQTFALADLDVEWDLPRGPMYRFDWSAGARPKTSLAAVPVHGSEQRYRLSVVLPEDKAAAFANTSSPDFDAMCSLFLPALPDNTRLSSMRWSSVYRVSHRIVPAYAQGSVFIAGDAAHIHPPVGGQGMNTGLQDAHNLAWKLSLAARGLAQPELLESYSEERHPVGVDVVQSTSAALANSSRNKLYGCAYQRPLLSSAYGCSGSTGKVRVGGGTGELRAIADRPGPSSSGRSSVRARPCRFPHKRGSARP